MTVAIIGTGLIGGSLAKDLQANGFADKIIGVDKSKTHADKALKLGFVHEVLSLKAAAKEADLIVITIPVGSIGVALSTVLDVIQNHQSVTDMGSTKKTIVEHVADHPKRGRYVPSHPMAGTENSGPEAAISNLYTNRVAIICDKENSDKDALMLVEKMYKSLFMKLIYMNSIEHDVHTAYVSHISHISSFLLANTVLEKEKSTAAIFNLASGGFESTVRLAKSSPRMWADVFTQNSDNVAEVLQTYINLLEVFKNKIVEGDYDYLYAEMEKANQIRKILE